MIESTGRSGEESRGTFGYYPVYLDIGGKRCVVVGGGEVALRKVGVLLEHGAEVNVVSPELCTGLRRLVEDGNATATLREFRRGDLDGAFVVVAATNDSGANEQVAKEASELGLLINVVDVPGLSNFIVPSYLRRGDVTVAVSTGGKSPALARRIRTELEKAFGEEYAALSLLVEEVRSESKRQNRSVPAETWQRALDLDTLLGLLRSGKRAEAKAWLQDRLWGRDS
jgi:siroheme synthase-like protein